MLTTRTTTKQITAHGRGKLGIQR